MLELEQNTHYTYILFQMFKLLTLIVIFPVLTIFFTNLLYPIFLFLFDLQTLIFFDYCYYSLLLLVAVAIINARYMETYS